MTNRRRFVAALSVAASALAMTHGLGAEAWVYSSCCESPASPTLLLDQSAVGNLAVVAGQVTVPVNGRSFAITCDDGQEPRIRRLAQYVDAKVAEFVSSIGQVGEARLLLLAALVIADELSDARDELQHQRRDGFVVSALRASNRARVHEGRARTAAHGRR